MAAFQAYGGFLRLTGESVPPDPTITGMCVAVAVLTVGLVAFLFAPAIRQQKI